VSGKTTRILVLIGIAAAAALVAAIGVLAFGGGKSTASKADYQTKVVNARDRVDYAYSRITQSTSWDDAANRMDEASAVVGSVANDIDDASVAKGFEDLNAQLATSLHTFSDALANAADLYRDPSFQTTLESSNSFGLEEWDKVNAVLAKMQKQGLKVQLLARH
jgi:hypothetical protein